KPGWKFTLHMPSYLPVMQYGDDRSLRETMYRESATRASEFGKPEWDNTALIKRIVELRAEIAALLGYKNYAEVSLAPKMAKSPVWHEDVRFFEIRDPAGAVVGHFYMDLYARETKRGGAWMDDAITRRRKGAGIQTPVAYLNCNFSRPVGSKPALFTHDEVL